MLDCRLNSILLFLVHCVFALILSLCIGVTLQPTTSLIYESGGIVCCTYKIYIYVQNLIRKLPISYFLFSVCSGSKSAIVTNTTVEIVVPEDTIDSVYGENGSNLARLRQVHQFG